MNASSASAPTCDYNIREMDRPNRTCGRPAKWCAHTSARRLFYYCETCAANAKDACRQTGTRLNLIEVNP